MVADTRVSRTCIAVLTALALTGTTTAVASADTRHDAAATTKAATTAKDEGTRNDAGTATTDKEPSTNPPTPKVPPYRHPGLSSSPSSGEPGLSYSLRGLSSQIVDPLGGLSGILWLTVTALMLRNIYYQVLDEARTTARLQGDPDPADPLGALSSRLSQLPGLNVISSQPAAV